MANAEGKIQNVKASIEYYIKNNLVTTEGLRVNFEGMPFESGSDAEWIQENILSSTEEAYHRQVESDGTYGRTSNILLQFNIFVDKSKTKKTNRHYEIRDIIIDYFKVGSSIDLYDFSEDDFSTSLQKMRVREIATDMPIQDDNFYQYAYAVDIDWLEKWS